MTFTYTFRREVIVLSTPMLLHVDCPVRTINAGCPIPPDLSFFEDTFRCQHIKFHSEQLGDQSADLRNRHLLFARFAHVLREEGFDDASQVVWSAGVVIDNKISGHVVFDNAFLRAFSDRQVFLVVAHNKSIKRAFALLPARVPLAPKSAARQLTAAAAAPLCADDDTVCTIPAAASGKCVSETSDSDPGLKTEDDAEVDLLAESAKNLHLCAPPREVICAPPREVVSAPPLTRQPFEVSFVSQKYWRLTPMTCFLPGLPATYAALIAQVSALRQFAVVAKAKRVLVAMEFKWSNGTQVAFEDQHGFAMAVAQVERVREEDEDEVVQLMVVMEKV